MSKHTPTPWHLGETRSPAGIDYDCVLRNRDGDPVALCNLAGYATATGKSNARHIVHCVNLHDELVKALEQLLATIDKDAAANEVNFAEIVVNEPCVMAARSVLAKAKEDA